MKTHKLSAVLLSLFMSINTVSICYAEETNDDTTKINTISNEEYENSNDTQSVYETDENVIEDLSSDDYPAEQTTSAYSFNESATSNNVTLNVEWNEPIVGQPTTFHVSGSGGSGNYLFRMDAPSYTNPDEYSYESVADPSRGEWMNYTSACESHDYTFTMTASGTYNFRFYIMDKESGVYYLRVSIYLQVSDPNYPSINSIVNSAVIQCNQEINGSEYEKALWLHDWLLDQLEYDNSLKWSSSESALTRGFGTCQAYESAYSKLLSAVGIENSETRDTYDGHTWNAVKLDGEWYQVDCTWDDTDDHWYNFDQRHLYFGLTDELMALAHPGHSNIYSAVDYNTRSTSLKDNYFVKNGDAFTWSENYRNRIQENLNANKTEFTITADNASYPPSISGIQNGIIAHVLNQINWGTELYEVKLKSYGNLTIFTFQVAYTKKDNISTLDKLAAENKNVIADGTYIISSSMNRNFVIDFQKENSADKENIELKYRNNSDSQIWEVSHDEKGYVVFVNKKSRKALTAENNNVCQKKNENEFSQKWIVKENGVIISALDESFVIDLYYGNVSEGSNIQTYKFNDTAAQKWIISNISTLDKLAAENKNVIADGTYIISSSMNRNFVIDFQKENSADKENIELKYRNNSDSQIWEVSHDEKGYVVFVNKKSRKALTAENNNVCQKKNENEFSQKWIVKENGVIISALDESFVIDLYYGNVSEGSNIQTYKFNDTAAQKWIITNI